MTTITINNKEYNHDDPTITGERVLQYLGGLYTPQSHDVFYVTGQDSHRLGANESIPLSVSSIFNVIVRSVIYG